MKTAVLPQVRVAPELRAELDSILREGETLSGFVEASVRGALEYRRVQEAFHARGEAALRRFRRDGVARPAGDVLAALRGNLEARRKQLKRRP
ncbi:MAG: YlcI/YnfO family protein [Rudaea sp.]|uniref:YlcI/YnfO family protein n=1 Tax=Rudaea sp. TaxID=2136325 RepID=UPI0039E27C08